MKKITLLCAMLLFSVVGFSQTFPGGTGAIPDNNCDATNEFSVVVSGVGVLGGTNSFSEAVINITHTWDSDLTITLIAPDMTAVILSDGNGGSADDYTNTHFRADAATNITAGAPPFTGNFLPEGDLSTLDGINADGTWILRVCDTAGGDTGTVDGWDLTFILTPACPDATLSIGNYVAPNFADVSLGAAAGATAYNWEIQPQGVAQGTAGVIDSGTSATVNYTVTNLVNGTDYTLYVQSDCGGSLGNWNSLDFTFNLPPVNNNCGTPTVLIPGADFLTGEAIGTLFSSTDSGELATTCSTYAGGDVWFSVTVPVDGNITIETDSNASTLTDTAMEVYSGSCGSLVSVQCDDDGW